MDGHWWKLGLLAAVVLEWWWSRRQQRPAYDGPETLGTIGVLLGHRLAKYLALPITLGALQGLQPYAWFELPTTLPVLLAALVLMDFIYYWHHRWLHEIGLLWAIHQTHHSAERFNLLAAARLNWLGPFVIQPLLLAPLVWVGFPIRIVAAVIMVDLVWQFFLHTEWVPRIPVLEGWLNTPAAHRMHHARNEACLDVNYGGIFMVWDRLFGTWREPDLPVEELDYGLTTGPQGNNPLWLVFGGLVRWARGQPV